jgi:hypothetical protein
MNSGVQPDDRQFVFMLSTTWMGLKLVHGLLEDPTEPELSGLGRHASADRVKHAAFAGGSN